MQSTSYQLFHSAKGTSWKSSDHKYIAIENGRYIYPEDLKGGQKKSRVSGAGMTPSEYRSNVTQNKRPVTPTQSGNVQYDGKRVTPSEYRALVESNSKSVNKDGSIRANSAAARGDVEASLGDKKTSSTQNTSLSTVSGISSGSSGSRSYQMSQNQYVDHRLVKSHTARKDQTYHEKGYTGKFKQKKKHQPTRGISVDQMLSAFQRQVGGSPLASKSINDPQIQQYAELAMNFMPQIKMRTRRS